MKKVFVLTLGLLFGAVFTAGGLFSASIHAAEWYKGQLHCHSHWSDGNTLPELAIDWYRSDGFHFMSLTDHNVLQLDKNKWREVDPVLIDESRKNSVTNSSKRKKKTEKRLSDSKRFMSCESCSTRTELFTLSPDTSRIPRWREECSTPTRSIFPSRFLFRRTFPPLSKPC